METRSQFFQGLLGGVSALLTFTSFIIPAFSAPPKTPPQASLVLSCNSGLCHFNETAWELDKSGTKTDDPAAAQWTIEVTRGATGSNQLVVNGILSITNSGSGPASIGNILVNLQRKVGKNWSTASTDVADAASGDAAVQGKICSGASSEGLSVFNENSASGSIEFTDIDNNTVFSLSPQVTIAGGATINLFYSASFDNSILGIPAGEQVRAETIVSFGNAGARGGSGAVCNNVDISGNGSLEPDEANVRSVPCRITNSVPVLDEVNDQVTLTDTEADVTTTGTVTFSNFVTDILEDALLDASGTYHVSVDVDPGTDGGTITNCASLEGEGGSLTVTLGTDPVTGLPIYSHDFMCGEGVDESACSTLEFDVDEDNIDPGEYCTFSQGGWGSKPNSLPGQIRNANYVSIYPNGLEVGIAGAGGYSMKFTTATAVENYLPASGSPAKLTADLVDPTSSASGVFGGQVTALRLNVDYSAAGVLPVLSQFTPKPIGSLTLCNLDDNDPYASLEGLTISQVLAEAEKVLGGGTSSYGFTVPQWNALVEQLVLSFDSAIDNDDESLPCGDLSAFAAAHLCE